MKIGILPFTGFRVLLDLNRTHTLPNNNELTNEEFEFCQRQTPV